MTIRHAYSVARPERVFERARWATRRPGHEDLARPPSREGGYEGGAEMVYYGKPTRLKPGIEDQIIGTIRELVPPEFQAPAKDRER